MNITALEACSLLDYPGRLCSVLFCRGCNYDCFYCHNRSLLCERSDAISHQEIESFLLKRKGFIDAVVISGGEPTLQKDLVSCIGFIKNLGFSVKLDTNGSRPEVMVEVIDSGMLSYVAVDVKAPCSRYGEMAGSSADALAVKQSVALLASYQNRCIDFNYEVRTTLAPSLMIEDILRMVQEHPPVARWYLQEYRKPKQYKDEDEQKINLPCVSRTEVDRNLDLLRKYQPNLVIR